jgi:hypothetical protein
VVLAVGGGDDDYQLVRVYEIAGGAMAGSASYDRSTDSVMWVGGAVASR